MPAYPCPRDGHTVGNAEITVCAHSLAAAEPVAEQNLERRAIHVRCRARRAGTEERERRRVEDERAQLLGGEVQIGVAVDIEKSGRRKRETKAGDESRRRKRETKANGHVHLAETEATAA